MHEDASRVEPSAGGEAPALSPAQPSKPPRPSSYRDHPITFSGSGREYFGIWVVNLLLMLVTFGLYYPWAKVRRLKYFYGNTWLAGHALDFHGEPGKMLRGMLLAGLFLGLYSKTSDMPGWPALVGALMLLGVAPALFLASMRFRLANTSWRGLRLSFTGTLPGAYQTVGLMLLMMLLPLTLPNLAATRMGPTPGALAWLWPLELICIGLLALLFPYLLWRIKSYQHQHYALGPLRTEFRCEAREFYIITLKMLALLVVGAGLMTGLVMLMLMGVYGSARPGMHSLRAWVVWLPVMAALLYLSFYVVGMSYWKVAMQNKVWSRTGNERMRFVSRLGLRAYVRLQLRNYLFIVCTLGLYWPFAVVASRRMLLESMVVRTRGQSLDDLSAGLVSGQDVAVGDAAADFFGLDVGM